MSLAIDPAGVVALLLDEWTWIVPGSLYFDSYEYVDPADDGLTGILVGGGNDPRTSTIGFRARAATPSGYDVAGPLSAIRAVRINRQ